MPPVAAQLALDGVGVRDGQLAAVGGCAAEKDCRRKTIGLETRSQ